MTSKNLFFKLMKEDLKTRLWAIALISLGFFFLFPVSAAFSAGDIKEAADYAKAVKAYTNGFVSLISFDSGMLVFMMTLISTVCGVSGFSYLNSKSKVDFYHSIPVRREKLFLINYLDGILILAVPYAVMLLVGVGVAVSNGADLGLLMPAAVSGWALSMVYYILLYSLMVVAVMLTGHVVVALLGAAVLNFFIPLAVAIVIGYFSSFFRTFAADWAQSAMDLSGHLSPFCEYIIQIGKYSRDTMSITAPIVALLVSAALAAVGCLLYRKRPSEAAGRAMAFAVSRPVIRIAVVMVCALGGGLFFWGMRGTTGWAVFGILCGGVITHCITEIIYHFDFKRLFAHKLQLAGCLAASLLIMISFRYDLTGYDRYIPSEGQVKEATLTSGMFNDWVSYGQPEVLKDGGYFWSADDGANYVREHMKGADTAAILEIAKAGVEETKKWRKESQGQGRWVSYVTTGDEETFWVEICYTLNSGGKRFRRYQVPLSAVEQPLARLYEQPEFKKGLFPVMNLTAADAVQIRYREVDSENRLTQLSAEERGALLAAYQQDFQALTVEEMKKNPPVGLIRFVTPEDLKGLDWSDEQRKLGTDMSDYYYYHTTLNTRSYYPVYPSFAGTIKLLNQYGIEPGAVLKSQKALSVRIGINQYRGSYEENEISDPEKIRQVLEAARPQDLVYYDPLYQVYDGTSDTGDLNVTLRLEGKDGTDTLLDVVFPRDQIPEFIKEQLTEEPQV